MRKKASNKAKKSKAKPKKPPAPDFAQQALANVEKIIGGKLSDGMRLKQK
jgi:hypothetical protein